VRTARLGNANEQQGGKGQTDARKTRNEAHMAESVMQKR
jgi:hypothetical protein